jgi:lysophospholipase L1-like esterase
MKTIATIATTALLLTGGLFSTPANAEGSQDDLRVVAVGDSITYGVGTYNPDRYSWPSRIGAERSAVPSGCLVTGDPCAGDTRPALEVYDRVLAQKPDVVIVAYGMNDLVHSGPRQIVAGLREVKRRNDAHGVETYVATLTPISFRVFGLNSYRVAVNDLIRKRFPEWRVIDFDAALISNRGHLPARFNSGDDLHPNARAYKVMAKVAAKALR